MQSARVRSSVTGITWPGIPEPRASAVMAILFQLEQIQWCSPEAIRERQLGQLALLTAHARETVPFYRPVLDEAGVRPGQALDPGVWSRIPLLHRQEIRGAGDALISRALPESHGRTSEIFTSGSTGEPIRAVRSQLWELFWSVFTLRDHFWHRRALDGKLATIRESGKGKAPYPDGSTAASWGRSSSPVFQTGPSASLNITCSIGEQVEWLRRQAPDYLLTHPSIAHRLAEHCIAEGIRLPTLRQVETISEILRPETRALCRRAWDVPLVDMYTTREAGYIALQCPEHEHYHVQSEGIFVEVLDADGGACSPGEIGRVVVTPLHNFAMPLIRYDIGDYAEVGEPCPCGRGLPVLKRILGRRQNMLIMPSGEERWPLLSSGDIRELISIAPIRQYQFVQRQLRKLELRLVVRRPPTAQEEASLERWVRRKFGYPFDVTLACYDTLPRTSAGKFQDFISEVATGAGTAHPDDAAANC